MRIYVVSRSGDSILALEPENVITVCAGPWGQTAAQRYAKDETHATDRPTWVYSVDISPVIGYKVEREVAAFDPAGQAIADSHDS